MRSMRQLVDGQYQRNDIESSGQEHSGSTR